MREELFEAIKLMLMRLVVTETGEYKMAEAADGHLSCTPAVAHIDLWNHNVEFIEQEDVWARPAVFIEFGPIQWEPFKCGCYRGRGTVVIHTVTDWMEGQYTRAFALSDAVVGALDGLSGAGFSSLALQSTQTNHNHEEILENLDTFTVRYLREV